MFSEYNALEFHLSLAKNYYRANSPPLPVDEMLYSGGSDGGTSKSFFWHARTLAVPFAAEAFAYHELPPMPGLSAAIPLCYYGISEYIPAQWQTGVVDEPFASAWAEIGSRLCSLPGASIATDTMLAASESASKMASAVFGKMASVFPEFPLKLGCAHSVSSWWLMMQNLIPPSDALDYEKLCMGELGGLLPRTGLINTDDQFRSAVMAAWKFASLSKDAFLDGIGGIEKDDKWQLVYPLTDQRGCVRPQNMFSDWFPHGVNEKSRDKNKDGITYIFAIWRKQETDCMPPVVGHSWELLIETLIPTVAGGICKIL